MINKKTNYGWSKIKENGLLILKLEWRNKAAINEPIEFFYSLNYQQLKLNFIFEIALKIFLIK